MLTRIANLLFSACALLVALGAWLGWRWAGSPPRGPALDSGVLTIIVGLAACWVTSAIGLFFRSRVAWVGSVIGAGLSVCACGALLVGAAWVCLYPGGQASAPAPDVFAMVFMLAQFGLLLAVAIALVAGLLRLRRTLYAPRHG